MLSALHIRIINKITQKMFRTSPIYFKIVLYEWIGELYNETWYLTSGIIQNWIFVRTEMDV